MNTLKGMEARPLTALFLDFDSYFASVEQHLQPQLRKQPIGIAPVEAETSSCIAASYEAKAFGVKTGTPIREARQLCPEITIVAARPQLYVEYHHKLVAAIESCIHVEAILSIDELWCWLPLNWRAPEFLAQLAQKIKTTIAQDVSPWITCTIGVAPNRWLAKMASKMRKPDGFLTLEESALPQALYPLKISDFTGIGRSMELRLHAQGVHTTAQLCAASRDTLRSIWASIEGERFWMNLHGLIVPEQQTRRRTIGHSHVLAPDMRPSDKALPIVHKLTQKAATRLRKEGYLAGALHLHIRYQHNQQSWESSMHFEHSNDSLFFAKVIQMLWKKRLFPQARLLQIGIHLSDLLEQTNYTPSLFAQETSSRKQLNKALDSIRDKHGQRSIHLACEQDGMSAAPMRIAFGHIPDITCENR